MGQSSLRTSIEPRPRPAVEGAGPPEHGRIHALAASTIAGVALLAAGIGIGIVWSRAASKTMQARAACMALDMAAAQGMLDEVARRRAIRALTSVINPHFDELRLSHREVARECEVLREPRQIDRPIRSETGESASR